MRVIFVKNVKDVKKENDVILHKIRHPLPSTQMNLIFPFFLKKIVNFLSKMIAT